jgi:hypothetical protein
MQRQFRIPFYFLLLAALVGLMLRLHLVSPFQELAYGNWLHMHSHIMFLGWLFNFINLAFVHHFVPDKWGTRYRSLFFINQILLVGMAVFFPLQGYGAVTIPLSTLHTVLSIVFCIRFIRDTRGHKAAMARWLAAWACVFFMISSAGPFALGPIMASGLNHSKWYYFAVYFYLHFQYNGFFLFASFALFFKLLDERGFVIELQSFRMSRALIIGTIIAYVLSLLWAKPGFIYNVLGFGAALLQFAAFIFLFRPVWEMRARISGTFPVQAGILMKLALFSILLKFLLQVISAHPVIASLAYENRYFVIAYLHLVLIGGITFFVFAWYLTTGFIKNVRMIFLILLVAGFAGSEVLLISVTTFAPLVSAGSLLILGFSLIMFAGLLGFFLKVTDGR